MQDDKPSAQTTQSAPDFMDEYDRRERTLKSLAEALIPLLREYRELDGMGGSYGQNGWMNNPPANPAAPDRALRSTSKTVATCLPGKT